jgi:hypothetical protein
MKPKPRMKVVKAWCVTYNTGELVERKRRYGSEVWLDRNDGYMIFAEKTDYDGNLTPCTISYPISSKKKQV